MGDNRYNARSDSRSRPESAKSSTFKFTNDAKEIIDIYEKNKQRARETISGGP